MARFAAIVVGVILVASAGGAYAYTHFIELAKVRDLRDAREEERRAKEMQRDRSRELQKEIDVYAKRREAIQKINRSRTLWSRKLDQFYDIVTAQNTDEVYQVWLENVEVPVQVASRGRRSSRRSRNRKTKGPQPAGEFKFAGFIAMESESEALALSASLHKALTGDVERGGEATDFYSDFLSITNPPVTMIPERDTNLIPPKKGAFKYELKLKPLDTGKPVSKKAPRDARKKR